MHPYTISTSVTFHTSSACMDYFPSGLQYWAEIDEVLRSCRSHNSNPSIQSSYTYNFFASLSIQFDNLSCAYVSHVEGVICFFVAFHISVHHCVLSACV